MLEKAGHAAGIDGNQPVVHSGTAALECSLLLSGVLLVDETVVHQNVSFLLRHLRQGGSVRRQATSTQLAAPAAYLDLVAGVQKRLIDEVRVGVEHLEGWGGRWRRVQHDARGE